MSTGWRWLPVRRVGLVAVVVLGAALVLAEPASEDVSKARSVIYSGTLEIRANQPPFHGSPSHAYTYQLSWIERATAPVGTGGTWTIARLKGSVKDDSAATPCSAQLISDGRRSFSGGVIEQGNTIVVLPPSGGIPWGLAKANPQCGNDASWSVPRWTPESFEQDQKVLTAWATATKPKVTVPAGGRHTQQLNFSWHCPDKGCPGTESSTDSSGNVTWAGTIDIELKSRVDYAGPGLTLSSPPKAGLVFDPKDEKTEAQKDLLKALDQAKPPCIRVGAATLAGVWAGTVVPVGTAAAAVTAAVLSAGSLPECVDLIRRAYDDAKIVNDPPDSHVYAVARPALGDRSVKLPACATGPTLQYCRHLRSDFGDFLARIHRVRTVDDALLTTVNRASAALKNHNARALQIQKAAVTRLSSQLRSALSAQRASGRRLAALIASAHVAGKLDAQLSQKAITAVLGRLKSLGVSQKELEVLGAASALTAGPLDILQTLRE